MDGHDGGHGGGHGTRAVVAALLANLGIAFAKLVAFAFTSSSSMLAEGVHSLADSGNQGLLLFGGRQARRPPDAAHPFGHGRIRYFYAFVVALVLFTLGAGFALYEGVQKVRHPHEVSSPGVAVAVLLVAIVLESLSFRTAVRESRAAKGGRGWVQFVRRSKSPELPVVLLEDAAALIGLVLALLGVGLTLLTDDPIWDGIGTLAIGVLLAVIATILIVEMQSLLIGEGADPQDVAAIETALAGTPGVRRVLALATQYLGPEQLLVGAKVELDARLPGSEVARTIDAAEARVREVVPIARPLFVEPDLHTATEDLPEGAAITDGRGL